MKINEIKNYKELNNLRRIRSKKFNNLLNYIETELKNKDLIYYFLTIVFPDDSNFKESWLSLEKKLIELTSILETDNYIKYYQWVIEIHRGFESDKIKNTDSFISENLKINILTGYPHLHIIIGVENNYNFELIKEELLIENYNLFRKYIYGNLIGWDLDVKQINLKNHSLKLKLNYLFKEYKFSTDVTDNLKSYSINLPKYKIYLTYNLSNKFKIALDLLNNFLDVPIFVKINLLNNIYFDKVLTSFQKVNYLIKNYIELNDLKIFKSNVYIKELKSKFTYRYKYALSELKSSLILQYTQYLELISKYFDKILNLYNKNNLLDNTDLDNFRFIEYQDFVLDLSNGNSINKSDFKSISFCYFDVPYKNLLDDTYNCIIKMIFYNNKNTLFKGEYGHCRKYGISGKDFLIEPFYKNDIYKYYRTFGSYFVITQQKKGNTLYLYDASDGGKSLITEKFLRILYGDNLIGTINWDNKQFLLENAYNKKFLIMNEFDLNKVNKDILLQLLDGTLVLLNEKYQKSIIISNNNLNISFGDPLFNRFIKLNHKNSFNNLKIKYEEFIKELPSFVYHSVIAYYTSSFPEWSSILKNYPIKSGMLINQKDDIFNNTWLKYYFNVEELYDPRHSDDFIGDYDMYDISSDQQEYEEFNNNK